MSGWSTNVAGLNWNGVVGGKGWSGRRRRVVTHEACGSPVSHRPGYSRVAIGGAAPVRWPGGPRDRGEAGADSAHSTMPDTCNRAYLARSIASLTPNRIMTAPVVAAMARATRGCVIHERKRVMNSVTVESHRTPSTQ